MKTAVELRFPIVEPSTEHSVIVPTGSSVEDMARAFARELRTMTRYVYQDLIGCEACISQRQGGAFRLVAYNPYGVVFYDKTYATFRGARIALGKIGSCWKERKRIAP